MFLITGECLTDDDIGPLSELIIHGVHAWDTSSIGFDLNEELKTFVSSSPTLQSFNADEKGESVIRVFSDHLCVAALINPGLFTLASQLEWLVQTPFANRHLVFAGRQSEEHGDWLLKDASVSAARLGQMLRSAPDASLPPDHKFSVTGPLNAAGAAWKSAKAPLTEFRQHAAPSDLDQSTVPGAVQLAGFIAGKQCGLASVEQRLRPAATVGNIRIAKPTLYVFPAGLGDSCYLGVDGFGLLVNTGAGRTPAFWPFLAHLERVDGLLLTHWDHDNLPGLLALLERLSVPGGAGGPAPTLGCALLPCRPRPEESSPASSPAGEAAANGAANSGQRALEASIRKEAGIAMRLFRSLGVPVEDVRRQGPPQPMTLYTKLGNGTLDLYPLHPLADSKEFKEFVALLQGHAGKPWPLARVGNSLISAAHANSLCCMLVWKPSDPKQTWTRLLLPGSCPQLRVIEGLERVKGLDCLKHAEYSPAAAAAQAKTAAAGAGAKKAPAPVADKKPASASASGDHAAAKKPAPSDAAAAAAKPAAPAKKPPALAPAPPPIVKKPVASTKAPASSAAGSAKPSSAKASTSVSASTSVTASSAAAKKDPKAAAAKDSKAAASKDPKAAAPAAKKPVPATRKSASPSKKADAGGAAAAAGKTPAAASAGAAEEVKAVDEPQQQPGTDDTAGAGVEEIPLNESEPVHAQEGEQQEAWALNTNNTNSAEADSAELVQDEADGEYDADGGNGEEGEGEVQPLGLPAPAPPPTQASAAKKPGSAAASGKAGGGAAAAPPAINYGAVHPLYFDLAYVPGHADRQYADAEYFKRVRARYYVISSCDPQPAALDALLEGKASWPEQEVTLVPTHSNQLLVAWLAANSERMQQLRVAVAPSASNCRIKLQNEEDQICMAYRVEF